MSEFIEAALSFPTVVFSVLLCLCVIYWVFTILTGGLQLGTGGGGQGGLLDALDGFDGAEDGVLGGGGGGSSDVLNGGGGGSSDLLDGGSGDNDGWAQSVFEALGIGTVPTAVVASLLVLFAWFFSLVGMSFVDSLAVGGLASAALTATVVLGSILLGGVLTVYATKPIGRLFTYTEGQAVASLVGRVCVIQTQRVSGDFGQAEVTDPDGAALLVQVRASDGHDFRRGEAALLIDFDADLDAFVVAPVDDAVAP